MFILLYEQPMFFNEIEYYNMSIKNYTYTVL